RRAGAAAGAERPHARCQGGPLAPDWRGLGSPARARAPEAVRCDAIAARQAAIRASTDPPVRRFGGPPRRHLHCPVGWSGYRPDLEQAKDRELVVSCAWRLGDAVDTTAFLFG